MRPCASHCDRQRKELWDFQLCKEQAVSKSSPDVRGIDTTLSELQKLTQGILRLFLGIQVKATRGSDPYIKQRDTGAWRGLGFGSSSGVCWSVALKSPTESVVPEPLSPNGLYTYFTMPHACPTGDTLCGALKSSPPVIFKQEVGTKTPSPHSTWFVQICHPLLPLKISLEVGQQDTGV